MHTARRMHANTSIKSNETYDELQNRHSKPELSVEIGVLIAVALTAAIFQL